MLEKGKQGIESLPVAIAWFIEKVLDKGRAQGFSQTRFIADMGWAKENRPGVEALVEFEVRANQLLMNYGDPVL